MAAVRMINAVILWFALCATADAGCSSDPNSACSSGCPRISVTYSSSVTCGEKIKKEVAGSPPSVSFTNAADASYVLIMVDPDAPGSNANAGWLHWMTEFKGAILKKTHMEYMGPSLPSGTHRYIFYLIKKTSKSAVSAPSGRANFNYVQFISGHGAVEATFMFKASA